MKKLTHNVEGDFKFGLESLYMFVKDGVSRTTYIDLKNQSRDTSVSYLKNYLEELYSVAESSGKVMVVGDEIYCASIDYFINIAKTEVIDFCVIKLDGIGDFTNMQVEFYGKAPTTDFDYPEWLSITDDSMDLPFSEDDLLDEDGDEDEDDDPDPHEVEFLRLVNKYERIGYPQVYIDSSMSLYKLD